MRYKRLHVYVLSASLLLALPASGQIAPAPKPPAPPNSGLVPKYSAYAGPTWTAGNPSCSDTCTRGPVRFTPAVAEGCENVAVQMNFRTDTHVNNPTVLSNRGDTIENGGGEVDWGDGTPPTPLDPSKCCSWDVSHQYKQARQYAASAHFGQQFTNANNPRGGCSYRCSVSQSADVTIYLSSDPICTRMKNGRRDLGLR